MPFKRRTQSPPSHSEAGDFSVVGPAAEVRRFEKAAARFSESANASKSSARAMLTRLGIATKDGSLTDHYRPLKPGK